MNLFEKGEKVIKKQGLSFFLTICLSLPHINMDRVFQDNPLTNYPGIFISELKRLGVKNPESRTYTEYTIIEGTQTLAEAGINPGRSYPELKNMDANKMTVAEYNAWQRKNSEKLFMNGLSSAEKAFASEKGITIRDLSDLNRELRGSYMQKSDAKLQDMLTENYKTDLNYVQEMALPFTDVSGKDWFFEAVAKVFFSNLIKGTSDTAFSPNAVITRGQIVTVLWRMENEPIVNNFLQFTDVAEEKWYTEAIRWASSEKIVEGYGDTFGVDEPVTREQLAAILWHYTKHKGIDVSAGEETNILSYNDASYISEYAVDAMQWACSAGIMQGFNGKLMPVNTATRAEASVMLLRMTEILSEHTA